MIACKDSSERRVEIGRERRARTRARILASAFELFGHEHGLFASIEDIVKAAGLTRMTFYNHFSGMAELREALSFEVTHDFLTRVNAIVLAMPDPRARASIGIRYYLHRARADARWAWSMINLSANGIIFGAETHNQAEQTVKEAIEAGVVPGPSSALGRDIILGSTLAAIAAMRREEMPADYPEAIAEGILRGIGLSGLDAKRFANIAMPPLAD